MTISEDQLEVWSHQGGSGTMQNTHTAIRNALQQYSWGSGISYEDYLQGSYRNSTNIYAISDVDLVVELTSTFYHNITIETQKSALGFTPATYSFNSFRNDMIAALRAYFGPAYIDTSGSKSIKVLPNNGRLKGDVVPAVKYRHYEGTRLVAQGITFWNSKTGEQIINYPKLHYDNGVTKQANTAQWYKPSVRIFKNARERIYKNKPSLNGKFPSYFVECLLYNVPSASFGRSYQTTFCNSVNWLEDAINSNPSKLVCQNGMFYLFGSNAAQWNINDAKSFLNELTSLWNS